MPGIVGLITRDTQQERCVAQLSTMLGSMLHEPFYSYGTHFLPEHGVYLGWVSHPNKFANWSPVVGPRRDTILIFSGEHFDHDSRGLTTGDDLGARLLSAYDAQGESCLLELNGWFAGLLIDLRQQSVLLFNDRYGLHRVYYHEDQDSCTFASEAKALLGIRPETRKLDSKGIGEFLGFGTALENRTIFSNVHIMPGGSAWTFRGGPAPAKRQYFNSAIWEEQPILEADAFYDRLHSAMSRALPAYFQPADSVGLSLTGGLDTRMIVAGRPPSVKPAAYYTYAGVYRKCFDVQVAEEIAAACGERHSAIGLDDDFFRDFPKLADETVWITDGCLGILGTHEVYFSRRARQLAPIRLTGNYGSEILRGASTFKYWPPLESLFDKEIIGRLKEAKATFGEISAAHPVSFAAFKQIPWELFGKLAAAQSQLIVRAPYTDNAIVALMYQAPPELRRSKDASLRLIADLNPAFAKIATDMGYGGTDSHFTQLIRKLNRYLLFKAEWYYSGGMPSWLTPFDHNPLARRLESSFVGSHKIEHYRLWFRDQLFEYVNSVLRDRQTSTRPYLNPYQYSRLLEGCASRKGNWMNEVDKIVTLELIQRSLVAGDYSNLGRSDILVPLDLGTQSGTVAGGRLHSAS